MPLNNEQIERYINENGNFCPYCGSGNLASSGLSYFEKFIACQDCKKEWIEKLEIINVREI